MSDKRFVYEEEHYNFPIKKRIRDTQNNETYDLKKCCGLLNEQQATIETLKKLNNAYFEKFAKIVNEIMDDVVIDDE